MRFFKDRFKELRERRGISQVELAEAIGVTKQTVSNWENEKRPHQPGRKRIFDIARVMRCSVQDFCDAALPDEGPCAISNKKRTTEVERLLLKLCREMDLAGQLELLRVAERMSRGKKQDNGGN